jgi:hypothetical protein
MSCKPNRLAQQLLWLAVTSAALALLVGLARAHHMVPPSLVWAAAILPVLPIVAYFYELPRWLRSLDEMQRQIHLEALLIQFGLTAILVMGYGVLAEAGVVTNLPIGKAWPGLWVALFWGWGLGQVIVRRKYR